MKILLVTRNQGTIECAKKRFSDVTVVCEPPMGYADVHQQIERVAPDVLIISDACGFIHWNGMSVIQKLRKEGSALPVVVFYDFTKEFEDMYLGAHAYPCSRSIMHGDGVELEEAIQQAKELVSN